MNLEVRMMFTKLRLKNYKSLIDVEFKLVKNGKPKNLALLYGENGAGKSNIANAFFTLLDTIQTMDVKEYIKELLEEQDLNNLNEKQRLNLLNAIGKNFKETDDIIKECKTINSKNNMMLQYEFELNNKIGLYTLEFDDNKIIKEELKYLIDKNIGCHFKLEENKQPNLNYKIFRDKEYLIQIEEKIEKYWGRHSLLAIINNDMINYNNKYLKDKVSKNLLMFINFIRTLTCKVNIGDRGGRGMFGISNPIFANLLKGNIEKKDKLKLKDIECFLNEIYTHLYADIKSVYYVKEEIDNTIEYKLFVKKMIGGEIRDIDFNMESTGTLKLLTLMPAFYEAYKGSVVILDEFDNGIHDLLIRSLLISLNENLKGQLIITTHNTLLMESDIDSDSIYFIVIDELGNKQIICLTDYNKRTHPNHNRRDLYLKGVYEAIPFVRDLDFDELLEILEKE